MSWLSDLNDFFGGQRRAEEALSVPVPNRSEKVYLPEERIPYFDGDLAARIPATHQIFYVKRSQGEFYFYPDQWVKGAEEPRYRQNHTSIEVEDKKGKVVAAVGWYVYDGSPDAAYTVGTVVDKKLRRRGIAKALWRIMIRECGRPGVHGCAASDEGFTLLKSMKESFPGVVSFDGDTEWSEFEDLRLTQKGRVA